jgi:NADH-quinone oxidoreductase subunit F
MVPETRIITKRLREHPDSSWKLDTYLATGGYESLRKAVAMAPDAVSEEVKKSALRGRGGANFGCAQKWSLLPPDVRPRYLVVNGDEGEPSTFKDRMLIERDPHQLIEGIAIAAYAIDAHIAFIYLRGEFALGYDRVVAAVDEARRHGFIGPTVAGSGFDLDVVVHRGAGAYICGEETALIESLEGDRGMPRIKPPYFPAVKGLYMKPTIVNNVETLSTLPAIIANGGDWYASMGVGNSRGTRIVALSGHVNRPGNYEVELGMTFRTLLYDSDLGGGIRNGNALKFFLPGGASFQWFAEEHLDVPMDIDVVSREYTSSLGSGAVMVFDETTCPVRVALRLAKFYAHESCGKCTPCREGTGWVEKVLYRVEHGAGRPDDMGLLRDIGDNISPGFVTAPFQQTTICPLGPSVVSPLASIAKYFSDDFDAHVREGRCPSA